jgi:hypothetical protein
MAGLSCGEVKNAILKNPSLAGYSAKRHLAALDIGRALAKESLPNDQTMRDIWLKSYSSKSPYVPETNRLRISRARRLGICNGEPPLMPILRNRMIKQAFVIQ